MAMRFTENCHKLGLVIHGDFIVGLPGETRQSLRKTIEYAKKLDVETIQVSLGHAFPGTEFFEHAKANGLVNIDGMADDTGHQLPNVVYPGFDRGELVEWVEKFYSEYYFRPKTAWRVVKKAIQNNDLPRLYKEAREYLFVSNKRKQFVKEQKAANSMRGAEESVS